jgi:hypothetical protein
MATKQTLDNHQANQGATDPVGANAAKRGSTANVP